MGQYEIGHLAYGKSVIAGEHRRAAVNGSDEQLPPESPDQEACGSKRHCQKDETPMAVCEHFPEFVPIHTSEREVEEYDCEGCRSRVLQNLFYRHQTEFPLNCEPQIYCKKAKIH